MRKSNWATASIRNDRAESALRVKGQRFGYSSLDQKKMSMNAFHLGGSNDILRLTTPAIGGVQ